MHACWGLLGISMACFMVPVPKLFCTDDKLQPLDYQPSIIRRRPDA